jgi:glycosyltransferase involved in cell wall biosynthesis
MTEESAKRPVRVLHVVGQLNRGGMETTLVAALHREDRSRLASDFVVQTPEPGDYDEEVRRLGARMYVCPRANPGRPGQFARAFLRVLREEGPFDIVHSHVGHASGFVLRLAWLAGVPVRLAHAHSDASRIPVGGLRRAYVGLMRRWIRRYATGGLAVSRAAAGWLFGADWEERSRFRVFALCGIDLRPFAESAGPAKIRAELGIEPGAYVIGHVGRFVPLKNQEFLVRVFAEVHRQAPEARLVLVGQGPTREAVEALVERLGLTGQVIFTGVRGDVPRLLQGMDVLALPSWYEGLGRVSPEAQAAGLPVVVSEGVPVEGDAIPALVRRLSLAAPVEEWAAALLAGRGQPRPLTRQEALAAMEASSFNLDRCLPELEAYYETAVREEALKHG